MQPPIGVAQALLGRAAFAVGLVCCAAGCGDDLGELPELTDNMGYKRLDELPRDRCVPGSLADVDPAGLLHGFAVAEGARVEVSARVYTPTGRPPWNPWAGAIGPTPAQLTIKTDNDFYIRYAAKNSLRALHFCGKNEAGELVGTYLRCTERDCFIAALTGKHVVELPEAASHRMTLLGQTSDTSSWSTGISVNVRVVDNIAYLARYEDGLRVIDVRDPARPVEIGHVPVESQREIYNDVKVVDGGGRRFALMASNVNGVVVIDVTDPRAPSLVTHFGVEPERSHNVHTLAVSGGRAYLANPGAGLDIYDIANPRAPVKLGSFVHPANRGFLHDLYVEGNRAYLNWWSAGMAIVDVSNPVAPRMLGNFAGYGQVTSHSSWVAQLGGRRVALHGDEQYGARLHLVDVTEGSPTFATSIGTYMTRPEVSIHNVMAMGQLGIVAYYQDGVRVLDLSNPTAPRVVAWFHTWLGPANGERGGESFYESAVGVDVDPATRRIYVADTMRGLMILRLDDGV